MNRPMMSMRGRIFRTASPMTRLIVVVVGVFSMHASLGIAHADDLVAPPLSLARLRFLLEECVSPPPTAEEYTIVVALHRDMVAAYGGPAEGEGEANSASLWRRGNTLYDGLRLMKDDPTRKSVKELVRVQNAMLLEADRAERALFEALAAILVADEADVQVAAAVRAAVERARAIREADRLLSSIPLDEPSGARAGLRESVGRLRVSRETRAQIDVVLADRDVHLAPMLRQVLRAYQDFAVTAADAFDDVFGGVLPPLGAVFSEAEATRLRERMRVRCAREGEEFLAVRRALREQEDATVARINVLLPEEERIELALRLSPSVREGATSFLLATEGHVRDALREIPETDPAYATLREFVPRWRASLQRKLADELEASRSREDTTFWDPSPWRGSMLSLEAAIGGLDHGHALTMEVDRIVAPSVIRAGGKLGNLQAEAGANGSARLLERRTMSEWRSEINAISATSGSGSSVQSCGPLELCERIVSRRSNERPEDWMTRGEFRRGIPSRLEAAELDPSIRALECFESTWSVYVERWQREVESVLAPLSRARQELAEVVEDFSAANLLNESVPADAAERLRTLHHALTLRDTAWRAAESADETFFQSLLACAPQHSGSDAKESDRRAVELTRFSRFLLRERAGTARSVSLAWMSGASDSLEFQPDFVRVIREAGLDPRTRARVEEALVQAAPKFAAETIARRVVAFELAALTDATVLGLRDSAYSDQKRANTKSQRWTFDHAARATADLVASLLDAAGDETEFQAERARLERAVVTASYRNWAVDPIAARTMQLAKTAAKSDDERAEIDLAIAVFQQAFRASHERQARAELAKSALARTTDGRTLYSHPAGVESSADADRVKAAQLRERADLVEALDLEFLRILGRERWARIAPPDVFELRGVGGR